MSADRTAAHRDSDKEADHALNGPLLTYHECGALMGITHEGARQIEKRAFEKLAAGLEDIARDFYGYRAPGSKLKGFHQ